MRMVFSLLSLALVAGCQIGVDVDVQQLPDGRISIEATRRGIFGGRICVDEALTEHEARTRPGAFVDWAIRRDDNAPCRSSFIYPEVPVGYRLATNSYDPDPDFPRNIGLQAGKEYNASVAGVGFSWGASFVRRLPLPAKKQPDALPLSYRHPLCFCE